MRQFYLDTTDCALPAAGDTVALDKDESHHLFTVLRGGRETVLNLVDGQGHRLTAVAAGKQGKQALVRIETVATDDLENRAPQLVLACAVVKGKRFEWAIEKAVELGVHRIIPLRCEHGVIDPREGKLSRWVTLMKSALKQCGRSWLPVLAAPRTVAEALQDDADILNVFGAAPWETPTGAVRPWTALLSEKPTALPAALGFYVGPEGGWSPAELALLSASAEAVSLGPHVLRAETAAAAGLTALQTIRQSWLGEA
ncbi:MAG: RsmE family RNA methyltransferase [Candidatus Krumholzibacteria bacterium]|nr:RsmE family RNA methyltransferase [Candidatus Krumholzibacteria bacterium]